MKKKITFATTYSLVVLLTGLGVYMFLDNRERTQPFNTPSPQVLPAFEEINRTGEKPVNPETSSTKDENPDKKPLEKQAETKPESQASQDVKDRIKFDRGGNDNQGAYDDKKSDK